MSAKLIPDNGMWLVVIDGELIGALHSRFAAEAMVVAIEQGPTPFGEVPRWDTAEFIRRALE
jgi:hypothetical protein